MLNDFVPVPVFNERTMEKMKKMERRRKRGLVVHYCKECNFATPVKLTLERHSRTHSGERPFECGICDKKFTRKGNLTQHLLTHQEGSCRFECDQCDYKSTHRAHLVRHLMTHSGVKPHKCDRCEFSATTKGDLKSYIKEGIQERGPFPVRTVLIKLYQVPFSQCT